MMDQLASIGVAFQEEAIDAIYQRNVEYYETLPPPRATLSSIFSRKNQQWAIQPVYDTHKPVRPFGLGEIM